MARKRKKSNTGALFWLLILLAIGDFLDGDSGKDRKDNDYSKERVETVGTTVTPTSKAEPSITPHKYQNSSTQSQKNDDKTGSEKTYRNEESNKYVNDDLLNQLIIDYNENAEFKIEQSRTGAYPFNAIMMCNSVYIMAYNSNAVYVDFSIEDWDDSNIYPVFRDFLKTMDSSLSDDMIYFGWNELLTGKYIGYKYYDIGEIECSCWVNQVSNGKYSYTVKTGCKNYKETEK